LVFLPGQAEIDRVVSLLNESLGARLDIVVCPLYGMLSLTEQRRAIEPSPEGVRKVVLATNIAESSLTIDGIHVVIDSGWARVSRFDPRTAMNRLHTQRVSQASTTQRAGRAGRLGPGVCYRLWTRQQQQQLNPHEAPEIMQSDLMPTVLQLLAWGCADINELAWLTPPPLAAFNSARQLLFTMGLVNHNDQRAALTDWGEAATKLPLHPRLGHMLLAANKHGAGLLACKIVALLEERDPLRNAQADLELRLDWLERQRQGAATKHWQRIKQLQRLLGNEGEGHSVINGYAAAEILALGFPDRIAQCRAVKSLDYKLANGRGAELSEGDRLQGSEYLVIADLGGHAGSRSDRIFMAAQLDSRAFEENLLSLVETVDYNQWDDKTETLLAEQRQMCGQLVLARKSLPKPSQEQLKQGLLAWVAKRGLSVLPWREQDQQWLARLRLARQYCDDLADWPDVSEAALLGGLEEWLGPFLNGIHSAKQLQQIKLQDALHAMLAWPLQQKLDEFLPSTVLVPTGREVTIDYLGERPVLAIKLQEMFGCPASPQIAAGRLPLTVHLLSPAQRPLAVTADLASFWANAYQDVKKDMKGRYPKHYWPDDPMQAEATKYTKKGPRQKE